MAYFRKLDETRLEHEQDSRGLHDEDSNSMREIGASQPYNSSFAQKSFKNIGRNNKMIQKPTDSRQKYDLSSQFQDFGNQKSGKQNIHYLDQSQFSQNQFAPPTQSLAVEGAIDIMAYVSQINSEAARKKKESEEEKKDLPQKQNPVPEQEVEDEPKIVPVAKKGSSGFSASRIMAAEKETMESEINQVSQKFEQKIDIKNRLRPRVAQKYNLSPECKKEVAPKVTQKSKLNAQKKDKMMQSFEFGAQAGGGDFLANQRDTIDSSQSALPGQATKSKKRRIGQIHGGCAPPTSQIASSSRQMKRLKQEIPLPEFQEPRQVVPKKNQLQTSNFIKKAPSTASSSFSRGRIVGLLGQQNVKKQNLISDKYASIKLETRMSKSNTIIYKKMDENINQNFSSELQDKHLKNMEPKPESETPDKYFCVAKCKYKTPRRYGSQGFICDLINVSLDDKKLEARLMKLKPQIMLFDTSMAQKNSVLSSNQLIKITDPIFMQSLLSKEVQKDADYEYVDQTFVPVYSNQVQKYE